MNAESGTFFWDEFQALAADGAPLEVSPEPCCARSMQLPVIQPVIELTGCQLHCFPCLHPFMIYLAHLRLETVVYYMSI